jgi:hypothetical protein
MNVKRITRYIRAMSISDNILTADTRPGREIFYMVATRPNGESLCLLPHLRTYQYRKQCVSLEHQ